MLKLQPEELQRSKVKGQRVRVTCVCVPGGAEAAGSERDAGWGRVCVLLQRLGKKADSRSLSLAHCDLTATDLLELGACSYSHLHSDSVKIVDF